MRIYGLKAHSLFDAGGAPVRDPGSTGMNRGSTGINRGRQGCTGDNWGSPLHRVSIKMFNTCGMNR
ncbi:hypothetical protein DPMN_028330 [Dreissena polymorpha]|uniref:Uncharacterized protein n=1 Tax=Dreissena polymorpha TaxID=45954 RepID=A0A9D4REA4_DREPO|nr:hypothetical protein DPMN_028330 [Dreissena polymorpha]